MDGASVTNYNHKHGLMSTCRHVHVRPHSFVLTEACSCTHVDWNWPISREKYLKIDWSVKMPLHQDRDKALGTRLPLHWLIRELKH